MGNPALHRYAIYEGIRSEEVSHLLEEIILYSSPSRVSAEEAVVVQRWLQSQYSPSPTDYSVERQVNVRLGLSFYDLARLISTGAVICGRRNIQMIPFRYNDPKI